MFLPFFLSLCLCLFLSFLHQAVALTLQPLASEHFEEHPKVIKRDWNGTEEIDPSRLDLQDVESFYWGGNGGDSLLFANLTVYFKDEFEFVIGMEKFDGMLKSVDCSNNMMLEFKDNATFTYAKQAWNWVSDDVNNTFVLVANYDGCGDDQERQPYLVNDITFDPTKFKVFLKAQQKEWEDVAKTYSFKMGYRPPINTTALVKRDDPDFTMSLASNFNRNLFSTTVSGVDLSVDCVDCGTSGKILVDFDLDVGFSGAKAQMKVSPQDVVATIQLSLSASGTLAKEYNWQKTIISIPIEGVKVGKFAKIGAFLDVDVGFTMDEWKGEVEATFGAKMSLSNSAIVEINALEPSKGKFSGWSPALTAIPFTLSAKIDGGIELYAQPSIALSAEAFGKGLEMSLDLKMPTIQADFSAMAVTSGVCGTEKTLGVEVDASAGVDLSVQVATAGNEANPLWEQTLFEQSWPLFSKCFPFGPNNAVSGATPQPKPPKKAKTKQPKPKTKKPIKPKPTQPAPVKTLKPVKPTKKATKPAATKNTKTSDEDTKPTKPPATKGKSTSDDDNGPTSKPPATKNTKTSDDDNGPTSKAPATKNTKTSDDDTTPTAKPGSSNSKPSTSPTKISSKDDDSNSATSKSKSILPSSTDNDSQPSVTLSGKSDSKTVEASTNSPSTSKTGSDDGVTSTSSSLPSSSLIIFTPKSEDDDAGKTSKTAEEPQTTIPTGTNPGQTETASQIEPTPVQPSNTEPDTTPGVTKTEIGTTPPGTEQLPAPSSPADTKPGETFTEIKTRTESGPPGSTPIETKPGETGTESKNEPEPTSTGSKPNSSGAASKKSGTSSTESNKPSTSKPSSGVSSKPGTTKAPTTTKSGISTEKVTSVKSSSSSSIRPVACRIPKREEPVADRSCDDNGHTHSTETTKTITATVTPPITCSRAWTQACSHYRSVMSVHSTNEDMVRFTCGATKGTSVDGIATDHWSTSRSKTIKSNKTPITTVATAAKNNQHHFGWLDGWTEERQGGCERDEWPPRYFWGPETKKAGQWVRYLPRGQNGGAGSMWNNFCNKYHEYKSDKQGSTTKNSKQHTTATNSVENVVVESGYTTTITSVQVTVPLAVFEITHWDDVPKDKEDGLLENPCWPSMIVPNDPGFVLLTNDNFYKSDSRGKIASSTIFKYASPPDVSITGHLNTLWSATPNPRQDPTSAEPGDVEEIAPGNTPRGLVLVRRSQNGTEVEEWVDWKELEEQGYLSEAVISSPAEVEAIPTPVIVVQNAKSTLSTVVRTGLTAGLPATTGA